MIKKDMLEHQKMCPWQLVKCHFCWTKVQLQGQAGHEAECELRSVECGACGKTVVKKDMSKHVEKCEDVIVTCGECNAMGKRKEMIHHNCLEYMSQKLSENSRENTELKAALKCMETKVEEMSQTIEQLTGRVPMCDKCSTMKKDCPICGKKLCILCNVLVCGKCNSIYCKTCGQEKGTYKRTHDKVNWMCPACCEDYAMEPVARCEVSYPIMVRPYEARNIFLPQ
ncbi:MAG: hypothetical protein P4L69_07355 [Desulfosporosinus sp.]|nr:hypothetical protein [Desulfosporosinus sp.]